MSYGREGAIDRHRRLRERCPTSRVGNRSTPGSAIEHAASLSFIACRRKRQDSYRCIDVEFRNGSPKNLSVLIHRYTQPILSLANLNSVKPTDKFRAKVRLAGIGTDFFTACWRLSGDLLDDRLDLGQN